MRPKVFFYLTRLTTNRVDSWKSRFARKMMNPLQNLTYKIKVLEGKLTPTFAYLPSYDEQWLWASALSKNQRKIFDNFWEKPAKLKPFVSGFWGWGLIRFDWSWEVQVLFVFLPKIWASASKDQKIFFDGPISNYIMTSETHMHCTVRINLSQQIVWGPCQNWAES